MLGFRSQPVDHYMRTYYMVAERRYKRHRAYCSGSVPRHQLMMRLQRQLLEAYPSRLKFSFFFHSEYTHDHNGLLQWADNDLRDHLHYLLASGHLERSLLILMSDHGARFQVDFAPYSTGIFLRPPDTDLCREVFAFASLLSLIDIDLPGGRTTPEIWS